MSPLISPSQAGQTLEGQLIVIAYEIGLATLGTGTS